MKTNDQKSKFIELRAKGLSYDKISEELNISKPTLIKWNKELYREIANAEYLEAQSILEQFKVTSQIKIETLSKKLQEVYTVLDKQDITTMSMKDLIQLKDYLESQLEKEKGKYKYYTGETITSNPLDLNLWNDTVEDVTLKLE